MKIISENNLTWVDIEKPTQKDIDWLKTNFNFHPVTIAELIPPSQREKVEHFDGYLFLVMYVPVFNEKKRTTNPMELDILMTKDHLITVHNEPIEPLKDFTKKTEKPELRNKYFSKSTGHLFYWLSEELLNFGERQLVHIGKNIVNIEDGIFKNIERDMIKEVSTIKRDILDFRIAVRPLNRIFNSLASRGIKFWPEQGDDLRIYFNDLIGDYERIWSEIDNYTDTIGALEATNTNLLNDRTNAIVKTFTILSFITFPAMLVATILQINTVYNPILGRQNDFWLVVGFVALTVMVMWIYFKTRKWL